MPAVSAIIPTPLFLTIVGQRKNTLLTPTQRAMLTLLLLHSR